MNFDYNITHQFIQLALLYFVNECSFKINHFCHNSRYAPLKKLNEITSAGWIRLVNLEGT